MQRNPYIPIHIDGLIGPPDQPAETKGGDEGDAVDELEAGSRAAEFVEVPMDVEERGGEFVEDEVEAVVIEEGTLRGGKR